MHYLFAFFFCLCFLLSVPFWNCRVEFVIECERQQSPLCVQLVFKVQRNMDSFFFTYKCVTFFLLPFLCKIYRNSSILLFQGNVSPRLCFSLSWLYLSFSSLYMQVFCRVQCLLFWICLKTCHQWLEVIWLCRLPLLLKQVVTLS